MNALNDFTDLHDAIEAELRARLPLVDTVSPYDPTQINPGESFKINTPAVLIEMVEAKPGRAISGGKIAFNCEFALHCILSSKTKYLPLAVRNFAAMVAMVVANKQTEQRDLNADEFVRGARQNWGLGSESVEAVDTESITIYPGAFKPDKGHEQAFGFDSMIVTFEQTVHMGDMLIDPPRFVASQVEISGSDNVGVDAWT